MTQSFRHHLLSTFLLSAVLSAHAYESSATYSLRDHRAVQLRSGSESVQIDSTIILQVRSWSLLGEPVIECRVKWAIDGEIVAPVVSGDVPGKDEPMVTLIAAQFAVPMGVGGQFKYAGCDAGAVGKGNLVDWSLNVPDAPAWTQWLFDWQPEWTSLSGRRSFWWVDTASYVAEAQAKAFMRMPGFGLQAAPDGARVLFLEFDTSNLLVRSAMHRMQTNRAALKSLAPGPASAEARTKAAADLMASSREVTESAQAWEHVSLRGLQRRKAVQSALSQLGCSAQAVGQCPAPSQLGNLRELAGRLKADAANGYLLPAAKAPLQPPSTALAAVAPTVIARTSAPAVPAAPEPQNNPVRDGSSCETLTEAMRVGMLRRIAQISDPTASYDFSVVGSWLLDLKYAGCHDHKIGSGDKEYSLRAKTYFDQSAGQYFPDIAWKMYANEAGKPLSSIQVNSIRSRDGEADFLVGVKERRLDMRYLFIGTSHEYKLLVFRD